MAKPDLPDFTVRTFTADELRNRWAYHNVRTLVGAVADIVLIGLLIYFVVQGWWLPFAMTLVVESHASAWTHHHFGAARTITKMAFGGRR